MFCWRRPNYYCECVCCLFSLRGLQRRARQHCNGHSMKNMQKLEVDKFFPATVSTRSGSRNRTLFNISLSLGISIVEERLCKSPLVLGGPCVSVGSYFLPRLCLLYLKDLQGERAKSAMAKVNGQHMFNSYCFPVTVWVTKTSIASYFPQSGNFIHCRAIFQAPP